MAIIIKVEPGITSFYVLKLHHPMDHECDITKMLWSHALKRRYTLRRICFALSVMTNILGYIWLYFLLYFMQQFLNCSRGLLGVGQHAGNANPPNKSNIASRKKALGFVFLLVIANKCENAEAYKLWLLQKQLSILPDHLESFTWIIWF